MLALFYLLALPFLLALACAAICSLVSQLVHTPAVIFGVGSAAVLWIWFTIAIAWRRHTGRM